MTLGWQTETEQTPESCSAELSASPRDWLTLFHEPDELNLWIVLVGVVSFTGDLKQSVHFNIKHSKRPFSVLNIWVISVKLCVIKVCKSALIPTTYHIVLFENTDGSFFDFIFWCHNVYRQGRKFLQLQPDVAAVCLQVCLAGSWQSWADLNIHSSGLKSYCPVSQAWLWNVV